MLEELSSRQSIANFSGYSPAQGEHTNLLAAFSPRKSGTYPDRSLEREIRDEVARVEASICLEPSIAWIREQRPFQKLEDSLRRQAKSKVGSKFNHPAARFFLLEAALIGIAQHCYYIDNGRKPGQMTSKDWDKALAAVRTLRQLEKDKGLRLWKALPLAMANSWGWFEQLEERLGKEKSAAKKPYDDGLSSDRAATRVFAEWLLFKFDDAPASMVEKFAELIGYETTSIARQVREWEAAHRTDSLT